MAPGGSYLDLPVSHVLPYYINQMKAEEKDNNQIIPYRTFLIVLAVLITLTLISVALTQIHLGTLTVAIALLIATIKSGFVLRIFMHLKIDSRMFTLGVIGVVLLLSAVIIITLMDYLYR